LATASPKQFRLPASAIQPVATGRGSCHATDRITVDGARVGFMYREEPSDAIDSGWSFFAGDETQEYADIAANYEIYDVNTIANYDPSITPYLDAPVGSAFGRDEDGNWRPEEMPVDPDA
jgi:hypothetical protein